MWMCVCLTGIYISLFFFLSSRFNERTDGGQRDLLRHLSAPQALQKWRTSSMGHLGLVFLFISPLTCLYVSGKIPDLQLKESVFFSPSLSVKCRLCF